MKRERKQTGITLIALVITIIVPYDKNTKRFNIKGFLHFGYIKRWVKMYWTQKIGHFLIRY